MCASGVRAACLSVYTALAPAWNHFLESAAFMAEAPKRKGGIRKRVPVDVDDEEDEAAVALLRWSSMRVGA